MLLKSTQTIYYAIYNAICYLTQIQAIVLNKWNVWNWILFTCRIRFISGYDPYFDPVKSTVWRCIYLTILNSHPNGTEKRAIYSNGPIVWNFDVLYLLYSIYIDRGWKYFNSKLLFFSFLIYKIVNLIKYWRFWFYISQPS